MFPFRFYNRVYSSLCRSARETDRKTTPGVDRFADFLRPDLNATGAMETARGRLGVKPRPKRFAVQVVDCIQI
jgi:hypothetical protein